jgi:hypothetical protein
MIGYGISILGGFLAGAAFCVNSINAYPVKLSCTFNNEVMSIETDTVPTMLKNKISLKRDDGSTVELDWTKPENKCTIVPRQPKI